MSSIEFSFEHPWLLLLVIPALAIIFLPFFLLLPQRRKGVKKILPLVLHAVVVVLLVLILSGFTIVRNSNEKAVMILMDLSDSTENVQTSILSHAEELLHLIDENTPVGVVAFGADQIYTVEMDSNRRFSVAEVDAEATDVDAALEYAVSLLPADRAGHIILLTDGKQTDGNADSTAHYLSTRGIRIDAMYYDTTTLTTAEMQIGSFTSPDVADVGDEITLSAEISSNVDGDVKLSLYDNDTLVTSSPLVVAKGSNAVEMKTVVDSEGVHSYHLVLETKRDTIAKNNESYACLTVNKPTTVLIIADTVAHAATLEKMLANDNAVTVVTSYNAPRTIVQLCDYDEVILSNVDYDDLPNDYGKLLDTYVGEYGRSLLAVGGSKTFMYGNMKDTTLEEILPVTFALSAGAEGKSVAMMLVLDCSGSMGQRGAYLSLAKQGAIKCVEAMTDKDFVGVISFNDRAYLKSDLLPTTEANKAELTRVISGLTAGSGTVYTDAIKMAHKALLNSKADVKHMIFLSDGRPSDYGHYNAAADAARDGISVSTIGLGFSSEILEYMAQTAGGRYYYVRNADDLPNIMLSETEQVTVDSLITGEFTPTIATQSALTEGYAQADLPPLFGYLGTTLKEGATAYLTSKEGHPIYASWNHGLGTVACFTSDLYGDWSWEWLMDEVGQIVTRRMVTTTVGDRHQESSLMADITVRGKTTEVMVTTYAESAGHPLRLTAVSAQEESTYVLTQIEPGVYTTTIATPHPGVYELTVTELDDEETVLDSLEVAVAVPYSAEYNAFADSGLSLLTGICDYSGGEIFTDLTKLAGVEMAKIGQIFNPMVLFAIISMVLILVDIAVRKLRWKDLKNCWQKLKHPR